MSSRLTPVAFDIETTGFDVDDVVTVVGFALPMGCRLLLNADGRDVDGDALERRLESTFGCPIRLSVHVTERTLFEVVASYAAANLVDREYLLTAYNGDRFRGGFDLPFVRTRLTTYDIDWPFVDLPYADLLPIFQARFNTVVDGDAVGDLVGVYDVLVGGELSELDPFDDSAAAVTAFEDGAFEALLAHNVADILRTDALAGLAERYCGKSEFSLKSLTPAMRG